MATTINLPDGETATLKDDSELTNREMKELRHIARQAAAVALRQQSAGFDANNPETWEAIEKITPEDDDVMDLYQRTCLIKRLKGWTLDKPLPTTTEEVDDLSRPVYAVLTLAATKIDFSDDFGLNPDPKATGANSTT